MGETVQQAGPRNIVVCMDGTGNAPKSSGNTNVLRLFGMLDHDEPDRQIAFYTPGVGTRGDPSALTGVVQGLTRVRGLISGYGMRRDVTDAYTFLVDNYRPGDRIFIFGFSRGGFAALGLAGACRLFGLVRPETRNMAGYVAKGISRPLRKSNTLGAYMFRQRFSRKTQPRVDGLHGWATPVHFVGIFDAVKALKYFKYMTRLKEGWLSRWYHGAWPFTASPEGVTTLRHAVSIDDRRIPYDVFAVEPDSTVDFNEVWFAGVHSDIGGAFEDEPGLGRIVLKWMIESAMHEGLLLRPGQYEDKCAVTMDDAQSQPHRNSFVWLVMGWRRRLKRRPFRRRFYRAPWKWLSKPAAETIVVHRSVIDRASYQMPTDSFVVVDDDWVELHVDGLPHGRP